MTTDTSAEALEESIFWLKAKYRRHGEIEDRIAAEQLEYFQAEKRRARGGVTDELIRRALVVSRNTVIQTGHLAKAPDEQRLRVALEAVWPEVRDALFSVGKRCDAQTFDTLSAELLRLAEDAAMFAHAVSLGQRYKQRAETAEAELAALKARIAEAPITQVTRMAAIGGGGYEWAGGRVPDAWNGKRVRLVVEE